MEIIWIYLKISFIQRVRSLWILTVHGKFSVSATSTSAVSVTFSPHLMALSFLSDSTESSINCTLLLVLSLFLFEEVIFILILRFWRVFRTIVRNCCGLNKIDINIKHTQNSVDLIEIHWVVNFNWTNWSYSIFYHVISIKYKSKDNNKNQMFRKL